MIKKQLRISKAYLQENAENARVCCDVFYDNHMSIFWYEVDKKYKDYLCHEKNDAFVAALLYFCMTKGLDIVSEGDVSAQLLFQLNHIYIHSVSNEIAEFNPIKIYANPNGDVLSSEGHVGASFSAGVDSFHTIFTNKADEQNSLKISCMTFFKNGFSGNSMLANAINEKRSVEFGKIVHELGYPFIEVRTNLRYYMPFDPVVSLVTLATALSIQKYMK